MSAVTERVAAGAAFLDEHDPEWWREGVERAIDLDSLDLGSGDLCVLGQRCPLELRSEEDEPYSMFGSALSGLFGGFRIDEWAMSLGFTCGHNLGLDGTDREWDALTAEWALVIRERRAAEVSS